MEFIAHRGASFSAPENSIASLEAAIKQGASRIEFDIQITKDGVPVVLHDSTTSRTTELELEVEFATLEDLRDARFENGESIPTLTEYCEHAAGRIALDAELKATNDAVARSVLEIVGAHGLLEGALFSSFDGQVLRRLRMLGYQGRTGLIVGSPSLHPRQRLYEMWPFEALADAGATDLVIHHRLAHAMLRNAVHTEGLGLIYWTAMDDERKPAPRRRALYRRMARTRPDGIIVGRVSEAKEVIGLLQK